jgi:hypothetical protein
MMWWQPYASKQEEGIVGLMQGMHGAEKLNDRQ